jgi:hypothetical protein
MRSRTQESVFAVLFYVVVEVFYHYYRFLKSLIFTLLRLKVLRRSVFDIYRRVQIHHTDANPGNSHQISVQV